MLRFFRGLQEYFARSGKQRSRKALALIETKADLIEPSIDGIAQMNEVLRQEKTFGHDVRRNNGNHSHTVFQEKKERG
jgi:hypothetical protein